MARYPSKECEGCSLVLDYKRNVATSKNKDGSFKYPVFEIAACSCFKLAPYGCLRVKEERRK